MLTWSDARAWAGIPAAAPSSEPPPYEHAVFVEQVRLLYQTRGIISISLIVAGLGAWAVWPLFPLSVTGAWLALYAAVIVGRLCMSYLRDRASDRDATAHTWCWRYVAGTGTTGFLWGVFGCAVLTAPEPLYRLFAVFVMGGIVAGSTVGNSAYLPAFYGYMLPAAVPTMLMLVTRPDHLRIEMGAMLALFFTVLAVVVHSLNRSILSEVRLRIEQGEMLDEHRILFAKLSKSEALMEEAQAIAHVGHWEFDQMANTFTASKEAYVIYGVDPAQIGASLDWVVSHIHPDDKAMATDRFKTALANQTPFGAAHRIVLDDGTIKFVEVAGRVFSDAAQKTLTCVGTVQDITAQKAVEDSLRFANTLQKAELEAAPDGILVVDADANVLSYNQRFATMWAVPPPGLAAGKDAPVRANTMAMMKDPGKFLTRVEYLYAHPLESAQDELETLSGQFIERYTAGLHDEAGRSLGRVWFFRDITARKNAETLLLQASRYDRLTGLPNRTGALDVLQRAMTDNQPARETFAVLYIDLDHFKDVNDTLGHPVGDALLCAVAERLRSNTRESDTVARFGGDEFAIIAEHIREPTDAGVLADKLLHELGKPYMIQGNIIQIGASVGIDFHAPEAPDAESLLSHADIALYRAKSDGRGTYRFFTSAMDAEVRTRVTMGTELRQALEQKQLFLVYQPQVAVATGRIVGVEALVRWHHPRRGVVGPQEFIPQAERFGLIRELDSWVLWTACRQAKAWLVAGCAPIRMSVNLSALEFKTSVALEADIVAALAETGLPLVQFELELTESVLMNASRNHNDFFQRLRQRGITVAIDDFGTGYSSLAYLSQFPSDRIKIAQEFVRSLPSSAGNAAIVKATLGLAHDLGMMVIAEGVETREQLDLLKSWGCTEVQGYYFSKPVSAEVLLPLLLNGGIIQVKDDAAAQPYPPT